MLKANIERMCKKTKNPYFNNPFTLKEIKISHLNTHDISILMFQKIVFNEKVSE